MIHTYHQKGPKYRRVISVPPLPENDLTILRRLSTITNNHTDLTLWTTNVDRTLASLTHRFAEEIGAFVKEQGEWDMTKEQSQSTLPV